MYNNIYRGQVYYANLPDYEGSVQGGTRPVVVISNNACNTCSSICTVVPITTKDKKPLPTHIYIQVQKVSGTVLCEQILTISQALLTSYEGALSRKDIESLNKALQVQLGLIIQDSNIDLDIEKQIRVCKELEDRYSEQIKVLKELIAERHPNMEKKETAVIATQQPRKYITRTPEQIKGFILAWETGKNRKEVAKKFDFSSTTTAGTFYSRHRLEV